MNLFLVSTQKTKYQELMNKLYRKSICGHANVAIVGDDLLDQELSNQIVTASIAKFQSTYDLLSKLSNGTQYQLWDAVIAPLNQLEDNNYYTVRHLRNNQRTSAVSVIALGPKNGHDISFLKANGIDHHFTNYQELIHFLNGPPSSNTQSQSFDLSNWQLNHEFKLPIWKRAMDIVLAGLLLMLFLPLMLLISLAILIERKGDIIYVSERVGQGFRIFRFYKFQSMYQGAEAMLFNYAELNDYKRGSHFFKMKNDPRSTWVGRIIRRASLDELPQLWNVLKGDMSIVGNRPLPVYEAEGLLDARTIDRFKAPAGITGQWQVSSSGRSQVSGEERIALDLKYAEKSSFWQDIKILVKTIPAMLQGDV